MCMCVCFDVCVGGGGLAPFSAATAIAFIDCATTSRLLVVVGVCVSASGKVQ